MAEPITVARPYAEAAYELARESDALPHWSEMLRVTATVAADGRMRAALDNPKLAAAEKESLFLSICGDKLDAGGRNFIRVLIEADRIGLLPEIRTLFDALKDDADGVARARISSAFPLDDAQLAALTKGLEKRFGRKVQATVNVDPSLIGGARIVVGDTVIDGSVRGELQAMASGLRP
ncbi:MAG TPA: F0F1 ATP synthase subunit delta [Casimicrobiaceae bacterium]|nr:F0F1 ATP synthase subunit delta [Casimicrobiaceae bacterium]